jgi:hypothetical protein
MLLLRRADYDPAEFSRLRQRHSDRMLALFQAWVPMRLIRRHRLDDPRVTDELHAVLVAAAIKRCRKAKLARHPASGAEDSPNRPGETDDSTQRSQNVLLPEHTTSAIDLIRKRISEQFHLTELRDQDLTRRSHRQIIAFPRQLGMYIARQATGASLEEIGRQFGGMHHSTVLHSINKIERMRRLDEELNGAITRLMDVLQQ